MRAPFIWTLIASLTVMPTAVQASGPAKSQSEALVLQNVELDKAGRVAGRLLDEAGRPLTGEVVKIRTKDNLQEVKTDSKGNFSLQCKNGGNCSIHAKGRNYACRLWRHATAPPKSLTSFTVVHTDGPIVRAQDCGEGCDDGFGGRMGRLGGVSGGQLLGLGLLAGAVVAIVIAVENDDDAS